MVLGNLVFVGSFIALGLLQKNLIDNSKYRELIPLPRGIERFTFGASEVVADLGWLRTIQDIDYCENKTGRDCKGNGWLSQMLDVVTNVSPHFRAPYDAGGMALSVVISDREGAAHLYEKAMREFPTDWIIAYKAAYHFLYEMRNTARAAELMEVAARNGAPDWVFVLAGRLYTNSGKEEFALRLLHELQKAPNVSPFIIHRLEERLHEAGVSLTR